MVPRLQRLQGGSADHGLRLTRLSMCKVRFFQRVKKRSAIVADWSLLIPPIIGFIYSLSRYGLFWCSFPLDLYLTDGGGRQITRSKKGKIVARNQNPFFFAAIKPSPLMSVYHIDHCQGTQGSTNLLQSERWSKNRSPEQGHMHRALSRVKNQSASKSWSSGSHGIRSNGASDKTINRVRRAYHG